MAGSTVLGSFDNQNEIADIAQKHGLWHHIDGCWGGGGGGAPSLTTWTDALKGGLRRFQRGSKSLIRRHHGNYYN
jgi:hypothetical protein